MVKCYNHPYISAIGSCIVCNKNLCEFCAYIINGKIYCKDHANEILIKKVSPKKISIPKLTSNLFFLIGIAGIIMIFLIVIFPTLIYMRILGIASIITIITFHAGFLFYFLAGYWIRERKRRGVALGAWLIIMSLIGTLHYLSELRKLQYFPIELTEILIIGGLVIFRIFLIILLIICWKEFKIF
jgi:hypothetical protein